MLIKDQITVAAPLEDVWDLLQDIPEVSTCVPGLEDVVARSRDEYEGTLEVRLGPVKVRFRGDVEILERIPPRRIVASIKGTDRSTSSRVKATFSGTLSASEQLTTIDYEFDLTIRGRLATFGHPVILATAKKIAAAFGACLQELLTS